MSLRDRQKAHARWLRAAAVYNLVWGTANLIWPRQALRLLGVSEPGPLFAWQTVAMMVAAYAPVYWLASKDPRRRAHIVAVGLAGKVIGPLGFLVALRTHRLPLRFGLTIASNDLVWWPAFASIVHAAAVSAGGWRAFLAGTTSDD
jgi:small multidrug resistance pump